MNAMRLVLLPQRRHAVDCFVILALLLGAATLITPPGVSAYPPAPDILKNRGFSPQTITVIETQAKRQEWLDPGPPDRSPSKQFFRNIYRNDWTGNLDPFGSFIIRESQ